MTSPSSRAPLPDDSVSAVQAALGAEHAAIWVYGLVSAFLPDELATPVEEGSMAHRDRRDEVALLLAETGTPPRPPEPAYLPPQPVTDQASALALLALAESDTAVAWRAVLERTDDVELRRSALAALTGAAVRATRWRQHAGQAQAARAFPGRPDT